MRTPPLGESVYAPLRQTKQPLTAHSPTQLESLQGGFVKGAVSYLGSQVAHNNFYLANVFLDSLHKRLDNPRLHGVYNEPVGCPTIGLEGVNAFVQTILVRTSTEANNHTSFVVPRGHVYSNAGTRAEDETYFCMSWDHVSSNRYGSQVRTWHQSHVQSATRS